MSGFVNSNWAGFGSPFAPAEQPSAGNGVVLFPPEALRFRSRWDKTMYAWSCFVRDMRAPTYRQNTDHFVSVAQAMRA